MQPSDSLPALRAIDIVPARTESGDMQFILNDQSGLTDSTLAISLPGYFVLAHLDGRHTVADVQDGFLRQFGARLPAEQIATLLATLDQALLLDNERAAAAYDAAESTYLRSAIRDNTARWPNAAELRAQIEPLLDGPTSYAGPAPRGIIAPHLDYARGEPCYREAYTALRQAGPAERYIILGTNHFGRCASIVATTKTFRSALGDVRVDERFIRSIESRLGQSICNGEFDHDREHSVELQVHLLQVLAGESPFEIVPALCPDPCGPTGTAPADGVGPDLSDFCDALAAELSATDKRTVVIAGADLSHVGQRFGDSEPSTPEFLERIARSDQDLLAHLERGAPEAFVSEIRAAQNETRICSVGCISALLRALPDGRCDVLRYHQAIDWNTETHVTCCSAVIY